MLESSRAQGREKQAHTPPGKWVWRSEAGTLPKPWISGKLGQKGVAGVVGDLPLGCAVGDLKRGPVGHQL